MARTRPTTEERSRRRFARRQESWFRRDDRVQWLDHDDPRLVERAYAVAGPLGAGPISPGGSGRG